LKKLRRLVPFWIRAEFFRLRQTLRLLSDKKNYATLHSREHSKFPHLLFEHSTPLFRDYPEPWYSTQFNKVHNLGLIQKRISGLVLPPQTSFSYWKAVGRPLFLKGYKKAMVLQDGKIVNAMAGGLCQSSNALFWGALNLGFTIEERHRHSYDIFPDTQRTLPFSTGATIFYNYLDLVFYNPFPYHYLLKILLDDKNFTLQIFSDQKPLFAFLIQEKNHLFIKEEDTIYRQNEIWRQKVDTQTSALLSEDLLFKNKSKVLYEAEHLVS